MVFKKKEPESEGEEQVYNNIQQGSYQQVGIKGLERYDITIRVIECIDLMGDFYTSTRFTGLTLDTQTIYVEFINAFFKVFHISATMLTEKSVDLVAKIEAAFQDDINLNIATANKFLSLFEDYLFELKTAGVYDPTVFKSVNNPTTSWGT